MQRYSLKSLKSIGYIFARNNSSVVPKHGEVVSTTPKVDKKLMDKIEKLSLIEFEDNRGAEILEKTILFVERLKNFELDKEVQPLYTVFEDHDVPLRNDESRDVDYQRILKNAVMVEEGYFVAPLTKSNQVE